MNKRVTLDPRCVLLDLDAPDKFDLITKMVHAIGKDPRVLDLPRKTQRGIAEVVFARERERTTAMGEGVALPHARVSGLEGAVFCLARLRDPVDFDAPDGVPVRLVLLIVVNADDPELALQVMARFSKLCREVGSRSILMEEMSRTRLANYFTHEVLRWEGPVLAADIMRPPSADVYPETPLRTVTQILYEQNLNAISVVDHDDTLVGIITCEKLFQIGMPAFFQQLRSIAFISNYDPFREYFRFEHDATARDVMTTEFASLPEDATLLEVVFALTVQRHPKVYIVREGKRVGVVDPAVVLDKVINL